jgi:GTP-binding protein
MIDFGGPSLDIAPMFIDYVEIEVAGGNGGHGCISFLREKFVPKGGPNGGDGGRGGSIMAIADTNLKTLLDYRYQRNYRAENGHSGEGSMKTGRSGGDTILRLPVGTIITDRDTNQPLADMDVEGKEVALAAGGKGGRGNTHFKSPTRQAPRFAQDGRPGEHRRLALELKLLADVGLVGLPNAGKSTILAAFSAARPKIANYPFTTLVPNLGIVKLREFKSCVMADIPGLIEGASQGKGLGHRFLRHIQRTSLLAYVIDVNEPDIGRAYRELQGELKAFEASLLERPSVVVVTKIDTISDEELQKLKASLPSDYVFISAVAHLGNKEFLQRIEQTLDQR